MTALTPIEAAAVAKAKAWIRGEATARQSERESDLGLALSGHKGAAWGFAVGWLQGREDALEEAAKIADDANISFCSGYEGVAIGNEIRARLAEIEKGEA